jgi:autotransporter translocation and assembly factor TamB
MKLKYESSLRILDYVAATEAATHRLRQPLPEVVKRAHGEALRDYRSFPPENLLYAEAANLEGTIAQWAISQYQATSENTDVDIFGLHDLPPLD